MRFSLAAILIMCPNVLVAANLSHTSIKSPPKHDSGLSESRGTPWAAETSVGIRYFETDGASWAPDRTHFLILSYRGNLSCDCKQSELLVFSSDSILNAFSLGLLKNGLAKQAQKLNMKGIMRPVWVGSDKVQFWAQDGARNHQLYQLNISTGLVSKLTDLPGSFASYFALDGLYLATRTKIDSSKGPTPIDSLEHVGLSRVLEAMLGPDNAVQYIGAQGGSSWEVRDWVVDPPIVAIRKLGLLVAAGAKAGADMWVPSTDDGYDAIDHYQDEVSSSVKQFVFADLGSHEIRTIVNAPVGTVTSAGLRALQVGLKPTVLSSADGDHLILVNTALPLQSGQTQHRNMAYVVSFSISGGTYSIIDPVERPASGGRTERTRKIELLMPGNRLLVEREIDGALSSRSIYSLRDNGRWVEGPAPASEKPFESLQEIGTNRSFSNLTISLRQGANVPPQIFAENGGQEIALTQPDDSLAGVNVLEQVPFQWNEAGGGRSTGGLILPTRRTGPLPLVIQAYRYQPELFLPDGPTNFTYAAQLLAAKGFAVLNLDLALADKPRIPLDREGPKFVERIDAAVRALADRGIVDRQRVGIIGFSRGGFEAYYAITHPGEIKLKAAIIDDSFPGTFGYYLLSNALHVPLVDYPKSFWEYKQYWLDSEPIFNSDRVVTPTLISMHSRSGIAPNVERLGAFRVLRRPAEFLVYPDEPHALQRPTSRLASYLATADWMGFWLKDEAPKTADYSIRWPRMKARWETQQAWEAAGHTVGSTPDANFDASEATTKH